MTTKNKILRDKSAAPQIKDSCPSNTELTPEDRNMKDILHNVKNNGKTYNNLQSKEADVFDSGELLEIEKVSRRIARAKFDHNDPFSALKLPGNDYYRKCLIKLQLLLGRQTFFKRTPLHVAVEREQEHQLSAIR